ncbi:hypothetical protein [Mesorhizobium sp. INR15]|uniref:hypothetical protein n=1 Tax=Mesorhizobium sp. INR15 TaxID=2654248 RepID=UPI0018969F55|nr:hypothetical protein [Mesorhizobium sp. INR15]
MTLPSPILATGFLVAAAAFLALGSMVVTASKQSMIKVRSRRPRPTDTKRKG